MAATFAREALEAEWAVVRAWIDTIPPEAMDRTSAMDGWSVRDLVAHVGDAVGAITGVLPAEPKVVASVGGDEYVGGYPGAADRIAAGARATAAAHAEDLAGYLDATWAALSTAMTTWGEDESRVMAARRGPMRLDGLLRTRTLELVVHGDDLARSVPEVAPPPHDRTALREVVKLLLAVLVERAPGHSVEVRIPPFAAVQCIEGTSHTRGTPPNTVESDPLTWIRLACGRVAWADALASGAVSASGTRADLIASHLPLL